MEHYILLLSLCEERVRASKSAQINPPCDNGGDKIKLFLKQIFKTSSVREFTMSLKKYVARISHSPKLEPVVKYSIEPSNSISE